MSANNCSVYQSLHAYRPSGLNISPYHTVLSIQPHNRLRPISVLSTLLSHQLDLDRYPDTQHNGILVTLGCHAATTSTLGVWQRHSEFKTAACTFAELWREQLQLPGFVNEEIERGLLHSQDCSCERVISDRQFGCRSVSEFSH